MWKFAIRDFSDYGILRWLEERFSDFCKSKSKYFVDFREFEEKSFVYYSKPKLPTFCFQHLHEVRTIGNYQSVNFMKFPNFPLIFWSVFKFPDFSRFSWFPDSMATLINIYILRIKIYERVQVDLGKEIRNYFLLHINL